MKELSNLSGNYRAMLKVQEATAQAYCQKIMKLRGNTGDTKTKCKITEILKEVFEWGYNMGVSLTLDPVGDDSKISIQYNFGEDEEEGEN